MRKWRAVLALVATTVAFAFSFVMLRQAIGPDSPWLGLVLMFCFLGLAKIAEPLFVLRMPRWLRPMRPWERLIGRAMVNGQYFAVTFFVLVQVLFNLYPILHLRLVRARLSRYAGAAARKGEVPDVEVAA